MPRTVVQPDPPPPEIAARLRRELTTEMLDRVAKFARRRVRLKRRKGVPCRKDTDLEAEDMAINAATLTVLGVRAWNPSVELFTHLCGVVRSVSTDDIVHYTKQPTRSLHPMPMDESNEGIHTIDAHAAVHNTPRAAKPKRLVTLTDASERIMGGLRVLAHADKEVTRLLDSFQDGCEDAAEARKYSGLSVAAYKFARRRLDRMIEALPENLDEDAFDALEVSYGY